MSSCLACDTRLAGGLPFCKRHWPIYKEELNSPWVKAMKNAEAREARQIAQAAGRIISLDYIEERFREAEDDS